MGIFAAAIDSIYETEIATDATFSGVANTMRVIDKSDGVDAPTPRTKVKAPTLAPAIVIRNSEVAANGLTVKALIGRAVTFNGATWWVHATEPVPRPDGASETRLLIRSNRP